MNFWTIVSNTVPPSCAYDATLQRTLYSIDTDLQATWSSERVASLCGLCGLQIQGWLWNHSQPERGFPPSVHCLRDLAECPRHRRQLHVLAQRARLSQQMFAFADQQRTSYIRPLRGRRKLRGGVHTREVLPKIPRTTQHRGHYPWSSIIGATCVRHIKCLFLSSVRVCLS
jgi:hypothetical protein